jgi:hypothetical protein
MRSIRVTVLANEPRKLYRSAAAALRRDTDLSWRCPSTTAVDRDRDLRL